MEFSYSSSHNILFAVYSSYSTLSFLLFFETLYTRISSAWGGREKIVCEACKVFDIPCPFLSINDTQ